MASMDAENRREISCTRYKIFLASHSGASMDITDKQILPRRGHDIDPLARLTRQIATKIACVYHATKYLLVSPIVTRAEFLR